MSYQMQGIPIPTWDEVKGYFTQTDVEHMKMQTGGQLDLSNCVSVLQNAQMIWQQVSVGNMPPGNPWGADKINGFYSWWKSNPTCPTS